MIKLHMCFLLKICVITAATNKTFLDTPDNLTLFRLMRTWILNNFGMYSIDFTRFLQFWSFCENVKNYFCMCVYIEILMRCWEFIIIGGIFFKIDRSKVFIDILSFVLNQLLISMLLWMRFLIQDSDFWNSISMILWW